MSRTINILRLTVLYAGLLPCAGWSQNQPATVFQIDVQNRAFYGNVPVDFSKLASDPNVQSIPQVAAPTFANITVIADVTAVNGDPARGALILRYQVLNLNPNPKPGQAISDVSSFAIDQGVLTIQRVDGTPVGTIMFEGTEDSAPPPGAPSITNGVNYTVTGGTGAYLGARGQVERVQAFGFGRATTVVEDPSIRRNSPGSGVRYAVHLIPMTAPAILSDASGALVLHSNDWTRVSQARPALPGEILTVMAAGLGPTVPGVDPGQAFTAQPLNMVNSPVGATLDGKAAPVQGASGYPGTTDVYLINLQLPSDAAAGSADLRISSAWLVSAPVRIAIRAAGN